MLKPLSLGLLCISAMTICGSASGQGNLRGTSYGGQQPLVGAHVYLYSPASSITAGAPSVSLMQAGQGTNTDSAGNVFVTTDQNGDFSFPQYSCTATNVPVYLYETMGNAGYGSNASISEMAYVGLCGSIPTNNFYFMDEATTVATVYAAAGYATDPLHISYSGTPASLTGIANAFANANSLVNVTTGNAYSTIPSGYASAPQSTLNTIANALATCVNQSPTDQYCFTLFNSTKVNGVAPTDTATAAMNIAHYPASSSAAGIQNGTNIGQIVTLGMTNPQFSPYLQSVPNDLTLAINFSGGSIANPNAIAIDGSGNAWIASQSSPTGAGPSVVEIANAVTMQSNQTTYPVSFSLQAGGDSIAIDASSQNIWIGTDAAVEKFSNTGVPAPGSPYLASDPNFVAGFGLNLDTSGNVWIAAYSSIYELSPSGVDISHGGYALPAGANAEPAAIALDHQNNVWVVDEGNNSLTELTPSQGTVTTTVAPPTTLLNVPVAIAIDGAQNVWIANNGDNYVIKYVAGNSTSPFVAFQPDTPSAYSNPVTHTSLGVDGSGVFWTSLEGASCTSATACLDVAAMTGQGTQLSGPGYDGGGYTNNQGTSTTSATAIDGSGNVWILNNSAQSVTELVGAAAPVVTPLALAVSNNNFGARP